MKHKLKNIANRPLPVPGTNLKPKPGETVIADLTPEIERSVKNHFFQDMGEVQIESPPNTYKAPELWSANAQPHKSKKIKRNDMNDL